MYGWWFSFKFNFSYLKRTIKTTTTCSFFSSNINVLTWMIRNATSISRTIITTSIIILYCKNKESYKKSKINIFIRFLILLPRIKIIVCWSLRLICRLSNCCYNLLIWKNFQHHLVLSNRLSLNRFLKMEFWEFKNI